MHHKQLILILCSNYISGEWIYLIVGIDPGLKVGYAAIDLNGKLVAAGCTKNKHQNEVISLISESGIPSLIATDVRPAPQFVKKIAARFNVKCFYPRKSLSKEYKRRVGGTMLNPHIRDAYAAAVKAYKKYSNRFRRIDKIYPDQKEKYKHLILKGIPVGKLSVR